MRQVCVSGGRLSLFHWNRLAASLYRGYRFHGHRFHDQRFCVCAEAFAINIVAA
jgi:hypothetical protein